jgi:hypothetical protein
MISVTKHMVIIRFFAVLSLQTVLLLQVYSQDVESEAAQNVQFIKKRGYSVEACYRMAEDFLKSNAQQYKAIPYLEYIIQEDKNADAQAYYMLAQSYYYNSQFDLAIKVLTEYIEKENNAKQKKEAKDELERFENARRIASSPLNVALINLGPRVNTKFAEVNPFVSQYENLLVFSSKRGKDFDIYVSKKGIYDTDWAKSKLAGNFVNTINDEFVAGLSSSGRDLFVHYNQVSGFEDINISKRYKGLYRELEDPGSKVNSTYKEEGACVSQNGDTLYFASDRPGGFGGFDLYYSLRLPEGQWGPPINMGGNVNTEFDENYPNLSPDGTKLYFASKGHNSIGGFDLFSTAFDSATSSWKIPENIGYPINNAYDNKNIAFTENSRYAYVSTVDRKSYGDFDIYKVIFMDVEPDFLIIRANVFVKGQPFNKLNEDLTINVYDGEETYGMYSFDRRNNSFIIALEPGVYTLEVNSEKFRPYKKRITIDENYYKNKHRIFKINLDPISK